MDKSKILIVTSSREPNIQRVLKHMDLDRVVRIDTDMLMEADHRFSFQFPSSAPRWLFKMDRVRAVPEEISAVWYRRPDIPRQFSGLPTLYRGFVQSEGQKFLHTLWSTWRERAKHVLWINDPKVLHEVEFNKPLQSHVAVDVGLATPPAIITNDYEMAIEFFEQQNGDVVLKTFGGMAIVDEDGREYVVYTNRLSRRDLEQFRGDFPCAPVFLQKHIAKRLELRITIVGTQVFTCAIHSQDSSRTKDDWRRYDMERVRHEPYVLPEAIQSKLLDFMHRMNLVFGAIDMIVTPDDEYVFIEVNPSGQWAWIEALTMLPISEAIANTLSSYDPSLS